MAGIPCSSLRSGIVPREKANVNENENENENETENERLEGSSRKRDADTRRSTGAAGTASFSSRVD